MLRYVVELENNHHYILIDTVTGRSYFTPAQEDANSLALMLNNYVKSLDNQRRKLKGYENVLTDKGLVIKPKRKCCKNCQFGNVTFLTGEDEIYCDKHNVTYSNDYVCNLFKFEE